MVAILMRFDLEGDSVGVVLGFIGFGPPYTIDLYW